MNKKLVFIVRINLVSIFFVLATSFFYLSIVNFGFDAYLRKKIKRMAP